MSIPTVRATNAYYTLGTGGANQTVTLPGPPVAGDLIGIWVTCNTQTTLVATAPTGWTKGYSIAMGTGSRTFLYKKYASTDGTSVVVAFSATPNCAIAVVVFNGSNPSLFGTIGTITTRGATSTTSSAVAAAVTGLTDDFSGYTLGTSYLDGGSIGTNWTDVFGGGGTVSIVTSPDSGQALQMSPAVSTSSGVSHAGLVTSAQNFSGDYHFQAKYRTTAQLRTGSSPNAWEMAWLMWGYVDSTHFYNLVLKSNGWEVDKEVFVSGSQSQVFLASGSSPTFAVGTTYTVDVYVAVNAGIPTFTIYVNGTLLATVTDTDTSNPPVLTGAIGLYTEDATVDWEFVTETSPIPNLVVFHEKATTQTSCTVSGVTTIVDQLPTSGSAGSVYIGSYDTAAGVVAKTATYAVTSANGCGYQIPILTPVGWQKESWS